MKQRYSIDARLVHVTGMSAGGAMTSVMGATYPDVFAAIGVAAGCQFGGFPCTLSANPDPVVKGRQAYEAMGDRECTVPAIVFHGDPT